MQTYESPLTVRDRILLHLSQYVLNGSDHWVPFQVTQQGIADSVGIKQRHVAQYVRPMISQGLVEERSAIAHGGKQHRKAYFLTIRGETEAVWLRRDLLKGSNSVSTERRTQEANRRIGVLQ